MISCSINPILRNGWKIWSYMVEPIGTGDGTTKSFQLVRNVGGFVAPVQNPAGQIAAVTVVGSTPKVVQNTDYTITNGLVTFVAAPAPGARGRR